MTPVSPVNTLVTTAGNYRGSRTSSVSDCR
jgi:di/tricarboxylate transporter